jgi:diguanylate cyclase (GGDEF)-like protein
LRAILQVLFRTNALDDRVRRVLVETLYTQPTSLAIGALCGVATCSVAAWVSNDPHITEAAVLIAVVALARIGLAAVTPGVQQRNTKRLEALFEVGAFSYALLIGVIAALTVHYDAPVVAQLMTVTNATGFGISIAGRNAGRPAIAIGQLLLSLLPVIVAFAMKPGIAWTTLAVSLALVIPAMMSTTVNVFRTLRNSIAAAETSARLAEKMQLLARSDVVTGLLNRAGLNHHLVERLARLGPDRKLALFWMDLDRFKEVNDALGHQVGDRLLAEVASRLRNITPEDATVARFGGDEFIVACETDDRRNVEVLAKHMMDEISRPIRIDEDRLEVGTSMGIAILPDDADDLDSLLKGADLALYRSKVNGRKQHNFFDPSMTRNLVRRREIEAELRLALQREELSVFFQPIVDLATGRIRSFEALVRWFHPTKGELRPDEFIPVAEETGAIITLGNWITAQAAKTAALWPDDVTIAVNLSPLQIRAPGAALGILNALRDARLDPTRLELEITETVLLDHSENTAAFIAELAAAGVKFALDDFGTGYSSLGYLSKYQFGKIKVDRSFVAEIGVDAKSEAIIRAVSEMGRGLGMEIVAEGIETAEQAEAVRAAGCTLGQGWFYSRAVPDYLATMLLAQDRPAAIQAIAAVGPKPSRKARSATSRVRRTG